MNQPEPGDGSLPISPMPPPRPSAVLAWIIALVLALTSVAIIALILLPRTYQAMSGRAVAAAAVAGVAVAAITTMAVRVGRPNLTVVALGSVGALTVAMGAIPWSWRERTEPILIDEVLYGGDLHRVPERLWVVVAIGLAILGGAWAWAAARRALGEPRVKLVLTALTVHSVGMVLVALSVGEVTAGSWVKGRPARRGGRRVHREARRSSPLDRSRLDGARIGVGQIWLAAARDEHESIGAFRDLAARLRAVDAPEHLIAAAHRAADDEVRHTRSCRRIAADLGVVDVGHDPSPDDDPTAATRDDRAHRSRRAEVVRLALESYLDGVIGEGQAAGQLERGAATSERHGAVLRAMARDERRHAELGGEVVRWCATQHPAMVGLAIRRVASKVPTGTELPADHRGHAPGDLRRAGLVDRPGAEDVWGRERRAALASVDRLLGA